MILCKLFLLHQTNCNNIAFQNCAEVKFDKETGKWVKVPMSEANEEAIRIYDMMEAELEITAKIEAMKLGVYVIKEKN